MSSAIRALWWAITSFPIGDGRGGPLAEERVVERESPTVGALAISHPDVLEALPLHHRLFGRWSPSPASRERKGSVRSGPSEVALLLLLLHRGGLVVVDDSALALAGGGEQHL